MRRYTDAEHGFGDIMPEATVHIRPVRDGDTAFKLQNFEAVGYEKIVSARSVMVTATHAATGITATYITIPASSVVFIDITGTWVGSGGAGTYEASGGAIQLYATVIASGARSQIQAQLATGVATGEATSTISVSAMATGNYVPVVLHGIASNELTWGLDIKTMTVYAEPGSEF